MPLQAFQVDAPDAQPRDESALSQLQMLPQEQYYSFHPQQHLMSQSAVYNDNSIEAGILSGNLSHRSREYSPQYTKKIVSAQRKSQAKIAGGGPLLTETG